MEVSSVNSNAGSQSIATGTLNTAASTVRITIPESFTHGSSGNFKNYTVTWKNPASGYTFYTRYICVVAVPTGWGNYLTSLDNVELNSNGSGGFAGTDSLKDNYGQMFQCVHWVKKYYKIVKGKTIGNGNADIYWTNPSSIGLPVKVANGTGIPKHGDIIYLYNPSSGHYHVGIIDGERVAGKIRVFQENVGQPGCVGIADFPFTKTATTYTIGSGSPSGYVVKGWVRN